MINRYASTLIIALFFLLMDAQAQISPVVIDPVLDGATIAGFVLENENYTKIKDKQNAIEALQATVVATTASINDWQKKIFKGLTTVKQNVQNAWQIYECYTLLKQLYNNESKMISEGSSDPLAYVLVAKAQTELVNKGISYYDQISTLLVQESSDMIMDAGERLSLMNKILADIRTLDNIAYQCYLKVHFTVINGLWKGLLGTSKILNQDAQLMNSTLKNWKF
ncbi:MAG: hypothetical protein JST58_04825 [Bacteroidetes bacterium]|nr:hypothetical protein [Bacteroidota bacterium]